MDREHPTMHTYVDVYDGPSSLQKRDMIPTLKEKERGPLLFETEREKHVQDLKQTLPELQDANSRIWADSPGLKSPQQRREDLQEIKTKLELYNQLKSQHKFYGKRDRLIRVGWRHGILGVEDADSTEARSVFY